jgi:hypothetical protein
MILFAHSRHSSAGYTMTMFDIMVFVAGFAMGGWVSSYFDGTARAWVFWTSSFAFSILLWCFIFLWLLPLLGRRRKANPRPDDHSKPNSA